MVYYSRKEKEKENSLNQKGYFMRIIKHGTAYYEKVELYKEHTYRCSNCGCEFITSHAYMSYRVVVHDMKDYVTPCPECHSSVYEMIGEIKEN